MSENMTLEEQKKDFISAIDFLRKVEVKINRQLFVLREGIHALEQGEDILSSNSDLAQNVKEVMYELSQLK